MSCSLTGGKRHHKRSAHKKSHKKHTRKHRTRHHRGGQATYGQTHGALAVSATPVKGGSRHHKRHHKRSAHKKSHKKSHKNHSRKHRRGGLTVTGVNRARRRGVAAKPSRAMARYANFGGSRHHKRHHKRSAHKKSHKKRSRRQRGGCPSGLYDYNDQCVP